MLLLWFEFVSKRYVSIKPFILHVTVYFSQNMSVCVCAFTRLIECACYEVHPGIRRDVSQTRNEPIESDRNFHIFRMFDRVLWPAAIRSRTNRSGCLWVGNICSLYKHAHTFISKLLILLSTEYLLHTNHRRFNTSHWSVRIWILNNMGSLQQFNHQLHDYSSNNVMRHSMKAAE